MQRRDFLKTVLYSTVAGAAVSVGIWPFAPIVPAKTYLSGPGVGPAAPAVAPCPAREVRAMSLIAVGDIMAHTPVTKSALQDDGSFDYKPHFQYLRPMFQSADLVIGNLETPLAGGPFQGYPLFNAPDQLAADLKWAGFSALNLANNHSLDRGWKGLTRTVEVVSDHGFLYTGAFISPEDRARVRLHSAGGVTVGLLGYTYGANVPVKYPKGEAWRLNVVDPDLMLADIAEVKGAGADFTVINIHFGNEYQRRPNKGQLKLVETLFAGGADLIIGHHPHVIQPGIIRSSPDGGQAAIFSLGNFISNQRDRYTDQALMIKAHLGVDPEGRKILGPIHLEQTRCIRRLVDGRPTFRVLPTRLATANPGAYGLTEKEAEFLQKDYLQMAEHLLKY